MVGNVEEEERIKKEKGNSIIRIMELTVLTITAFIFILEQHPDSIFIRISIVLLVLSIILSLLCLYALNYVPEVAEIAEPWGYTYINKEKTKYLKKILLRHYDLMFYILYGLAISLLALEIILRFIEEIIIRISENAKMFSMR